MSNQSNSETRSSQGEAGSANQGAFSQWQPIETAPAVRGERIIGWCVFVAGAEARELVCHVPLSPYSNGQQTPTWWYQGCMQNPSHWMPLPSPPEGAAR